MGDDLDRARLATLFDTMSARVYAYARRHCSATDAQDVVSDTFLIAWRRIADVPDPALPWLLVVARNCIANRRRSLRRHDHLTDTAATLDRLAAPATGADHDVVERATFLEALVQLTDVEREALLLVAWDGLDNRDAAAVAGCSKRAFEVRLSRARARLARTVDRTSDRTPDSIASASSKER